MDTLVFIYALERNSQFVRPAEAVLRAILQGRLTAIASTLLVAELLVLPYRQQRHDVADRYVNYLQTYPNLALVPPGVAICRRAAELRGGHEGMRLPDAIHLATAIEGGASAFITNDHRLPSVAEGTRLLLSDLASA
ncbi:MAG: type II toxin-antitoxin system VapC family toxin [Chloroflexota bacterium]